MPKYAIIETDSGMTVVPILPGKTAEQMAIQMGGVVVDPGPYPSYEEAYDALLALRQEEEEAGE
ncbi:MAG: hypothetical protein NZ899_04050 [Thermoguttaceae bacterium]|nr:hypothetical protein [Thermoguttaceae bacterium]MDW8077693.1 hypothetical protein [Thermoguttaceae bacterium]